MTNVTHIETEVNYALNFAEQIIPWVSTIWPGFGPVGAMILQAIKGTRIIEEQLGIPTTAALVAKTAHDTPGAPNAAPLS